MEAPPHRMPRWIARALTASLAAACSTAPGADRGADGGGAGETSMRARGARFEVPLGAGAQLTARGEELTLGPGAGWASLAGDASVSLEGASNLEATADEIRIVTDGPVVEMRGNVRAAMAVPDGAGMPAEVSSEIP